MKKSGIWCVTVLCALMLSGELRGAPAKEPSGSGSPIAMHVGGGWRKMSREACAIKAVEAMGIQEHFIQAEVDDAGDAWGMNENATVLVKSVCQGDGVYIYVVAASEDSKQAERLRNAVRQHVFDGPYRANVPKRIRTSDANRRAVAPAMQWGGEERSSSLGIFGNVAEDALKRYALQVTKDGTELILGSSPSSAAVAFYVKGAAENSGYIGVVAASGTCQDATRLCNSIRSTIFHARPWAVILCKFSDQPTEPYPPNYYRECVTEDGLGKGREFDYFRQVSYGWVDMVGSKVFGWFSMTSHATPELGSLHYPGDRRKLADWGIELARDNHIDLTPFCGVLVVYNFQTDSGAAGGHLVVLGNHSRDWSPTFNCHELGHGFDLPHSWSASPDVEYGDRWDMMSAMRVCTFRNQFGDNGPGFNAFNLRRLGCIPADRIWSHTGNFAPQTISLAALGEPDAKGYLMASITAAAEGIAKTEYVIEFRRKRGWDAGIPQDTVLVHEVRDNGICYLISRKKSPELLPGQELEIPARKLSIKVLGFDALESTAQVSISAAKLEE